MDSLLLKLNPVTTVFLADVDFSNANMWKVNRAFRGFLFVFLAAWTYRNIIYSQYEDPLIHFIFNRNVLPAGTIIALLRSSNLEPVSLNIVAAYWSIVGVFIKGHSGDTVWTLGPVWSSNFSEPSLEFSFKNLDGIHLPGDVDLL